MTALRLWLVGTVILLAAVAVWAFAPVLIFIGLLAAALGLLSYLAIKFARAIERARWPSRGERGDPR